MTQITRDDIEGYSSFAELLTTGMPFGAIKNITRALGEINYDKAGPAEITASLRGLMSPAAAQLAYQKYKKEIEPVQECFHKRCMPRMGFEEYTEMMAGMVFAKLCQDYHRKYTENKKPAQHPPDESTLESFTATQKGTGRE